MIEVYKEAVAIAQSNGMKRYDDYYTEDGVVYISIVRSPEFDKYFFINQSDARLFAKSSDPSKFIERYIKANYEGVKC